MTVTASYAITMTAATAIVHADDRTAAAGAHTLFRREKILTPDQRIAVVPIISGNALRGVLRRIGEDLLTPVLDYPRLPVAAAHLLRNGGALGKTRTPLTPEQEHQLKTLVPVVGLFGGAANGRVLSGKLSVGKVIPATTATAHLLADPPAPLPAVHAIVGQESLSHFTDTGTHDRGDDSAMLRYTVETLVAGTSLHTHIHLTHATDVEYAFFTAILDRFATRGHIGGRIGAGYGRVRDVAITVHLKSTPSPGAVDWQAEIAAHRDDAVAILAKIV